MSRLPSLRQLGRLGLWWSRDGFGIEWRLDEHRWRFLRVYWQ